ncbi:probable cytochrome P450 304a1, partial [Sitodiplosis mosellana]|uniref:probable cytochrome P450 304a1 n=1 Tax=Sitodiplosis mosellana TaxID=263140 RepID=UPI0024440F37
CERYRDQCSASPIPFFALFEKNPGQIFYFFIEILSNFNLNRLLLLFIFSLPYIEATIRESLRHETLVPSGLPHTAIADTTFMGYDIPKGTIVFSSLHGVHVDEDTWDAPEQFKPERFLDESGIFSPKLDKSLPFGAGKRVCAGETFARNSLFLIVSALVQNFNIELPANEKLPDPRETLSGFIRYPPDFRLKFLTR